MSTLTSATWNSTVSWTSEDQGEAIAYDKSSTQHKSKQDFAQLSTRRVYAKTLTVTAACGILDIDLTSLTDVNNNALNFSAIEAIKVENNNTDAGEDILVGNGGSNSWAAPWNGSKTAQQLVTAGDVWHQTFSTTPQTVDGTNKDLRFHNVGATQDITIDVIIEGTGS